MIAKSLASDRSEIGTKLKIKKNSERAVPKIKLNLHVTVQILA